MEKILNMENKCFWQGEKVRLRALKMEDWELKYKEYEHTETRRLIQCKVELPITEAVFKEKFEKTINFNSPNAPNSIPFAIENLDGKFVGWISIHSKNEKDGTFSFAIGLFPTFRNLGYGEEATRIILKYGFYELRMQKCNSGCLYNNEASKNLHKKLGFVEEGRLRRNIYTDGQYYDEALFGLLSEEFDEKEKELLIRRVGL